MTRRLPRPCDDDDEHRIVGRPAVAPRRTLPAVAACSNGAAARPAAVSPPCSCCTASSVRKSRPPTWPPFCRGCSTAGGSSSRCWRPGTSSAPGAPSCSSATPAAASGRHRGDGRAGFASSGSASRCSSRSFSSTSSSICGRLPRATAWLVLGYFAAALAVDLLFTGATFCKYLCPIGQFSFVASTMSPLELQVQQPDTCRTCRTVDCIKGRRDEAVPVRVVRRGCELALFLPAKVGNLDCTFCLDCVQACPHDNIALATRAAGARAGRFAPSVRHWMVAAAA